MTNSRTKNRTALQLMMSRCSCGLHGILKKERRLWPHSIGRQWEGFSDLQHNQELRQLDRESGLRYGDDMAQTREQKPVKVVLSPHGAALLRAMHDRHPEMSAADIVEEALAERVGREPGSVPTRSRTSEEIRAWLDELAAFSDRIPPRPGETFSREMIYQDHL